MSRIHLDTGAFTTHLRITLAPLVDEFAEMYAPYSVEDPPGIDDARVEVALARHVGRAVPQDRTRIDAAGLQVAGHRFADLWNLLLRSCDKPARSRFCL